MKIVKVCETSFTDHASSFFADFQLHLMNYTNTWSCSLLVIYHMQDKVTLDLDLEIMSVCSYDQISAAGKTMLYVNINLKKKKDVQYIG